MAENYTPIDTADEQGDLGAAIQTLILENLKSLKTCFLAEITAIEKQFVSVKPIIKADTKESDVIINDCLVAFFMSGEWHTQFKLKVGDIGLCIVNGRDLSDYKGSGSGGVAPSKRFKNMNDSIFFPLSLYKSKEVESVDFTILGAKGDEITFKDGTLTINATADIKSKAGGAFNSEATSSHTLKSPTTTIDSPAITLGGNVVVSGSITAGGSSPAQIGNDSGTIKDCFDAIWSAMDLIASGMKGGSTTPAPYNGGKASLQAKVNSIVG